MSFMPQLPESADTLQGEAPFHLRYEDLAMDGRMTTIAMPSGLGTLWRSSTDSLPIWEMRKQGIVPILSHLWIDASEEPIELTKAARCSGQAVLAHTRNEEGQTSRILLEMQVQLWGTRGRVFGATPKGAGEEVLAGSVYARHVFTRPFAAREDRRVLRFDHKDLPEVPAPQVSWTDRSLFTETPASATPVDTRMVPDPCPVAFGLHQCDSNQHVNSLAYPKLFENAAQLRFAQRELGNKTMSRQVAIAFHKPFFAGQRATLELQAYQGSGERGRELAASGAFYGKGDASRAHCQLHMAFR